ncbi:unnamed protein product, partial [Ectocarpus sp. 6 AP-2014]
PPWATGTSRSNKEIVISASQSSLFFCLLPREGYKAHKEKEKKKNGNKCRNTRPHLNLYSRHATTDNADESTKKTTTAAAAGPPVVLFPLTSKNGLFAERVYDTAY